ncbi:hypothetical protein F1C76_02045 [Geodermatophilaceae bacterium NBWT11]|nr:hypothetical protein F1C76_02045 [Geodermatophilaceae bacterium NBWT11]
MTATPLPTIPVTTDAELTERWEGLLALGSQPSRRSLFLAWLRPDGTMVPLCVPVEDLDAEPDRRAIGNLVQLHDVVAESEGVDRADLHLAMCLERRGPAGLSPDDHAWASALESVLRDREGLDCSLHVGNGRAAVCVLPRPMWPAA